MITSEESQRDDRTIAKNALMQVLGVLESLSARERARVFHSLVDNEAARRSCGFQFIANFVNDRIFVEQGADKAVDYWNYLASTRSDPRLTADFVTNPTDWATVT